MWVYGSGFPKSHDVSKAIDKAAGAEREVVGKVQPGAVQRDGRKTYGSGQGSSERLRNGRSANDHRPRHRRRQAVVRLGHGSEAGARAIIVARKPLCGTVAQNVLRHGTGGINVDGCRVGTEVICQQEKPGFSDSPIYGTGAEGLTFVCNTNTPAAGPPISSTTAATRWWGCFRRRRRQRSPAKAGNNLCAGTFMKQLQSTLHVTGQDPSGTATGSAARFFYCAKASKDRDRGARGWIVKAFTDTARALGKISTPLPQTTPPALMRYLCRLVTPPGGIVLDPFMGSGSTGKAAMLEGFRFIGIEREAEYVEIARARIGAV
jgi:hypothetical protein